MNIDWTALGIIISIIIGLGGLLLQFLKRPQEVKQAKADTNRSVAEAGKAAAESVDLLLIPLNDKIAALNTRVAALEQERDALRESRDQREIDHAEEIKGLKNTQAVQQSEIDELRGGVAVLVAQLEAAGLEPRYKPKPKFSEKP